MSHLHEPLYHCLNVVSTLFRHTTTIFEGGGKTTKKSFFAIFPACFLIRLPISANMSNFFLHFFSGTKHKAPLGGCRSTPPRSNPRPLPIPGRFRVRAPGGSGPGLRPVLILAPARPRKIRPAGRVPCPPGTRRPDHQRYAGPIPAPAPGPLRLRRLRRRPAGPGPGLRPAAPRSGPRLRRPRLRLARAGPLRGPGLGYRAGSRPSPRLRQPPGGPRCGGGVSGSRRLAPAGPSATGPGVVPPALRAAAGPPAGVGGPWAAPCGRRAPSVPPRVLSLIHI